MTSKHVLIDMVLFFQKSFCIFASHKNFMDRPQKIKITFE